MSTYRVKIGERSFEVQVENIHSRPVVAVVDGERIEVWPEEEELLVSHAVLARETVPAVRKQPGPASDAPALPLDKVVRAPIPGMILHVRVREGDEVEKGQELCVLEAMKMKNTIRSGFSGRVAKIHVSQGETVKHNDVLIEFV